MRMMEFNALGFALLVALPSPMLADALSYTEQPCDGEPFATALKEIVRLEPSAFTLLPRQISDWMQQEGYTVPQSYCDSAPHNVASGNLNEDSILDWAVLCSRADTSRVAIF